MWKHDYKNGKTKELRMPYKKLKILVEIGF